jgi:nitronate monooxygenase
VLDELPTAVWFAFGNDLGKYIAQVHAHDANRAHKTIIFVIVSSVAEALCATNEWKVDVLVVQGTCLHLVMGSQLTYACRY